MYTIAVTYQEFEYAKSLGKEKIFLAAEAFMFLF